MNTSEVLGLICDISWLFAYIAIIWRGFKDRSLAMPMVALCANIMWEGIYSFIYQPFSSYLHYSSIAWFLFDIPIAWQCFLYGEKDFPPTFTRNIFRITFFATLAICFAFIINVFPDLNDTEGVYTGFVINMVMSIVFVYMLLRRNNINGQSIYIALFKFIGTLFAFLNICYELPTAAMQPTNFPAIITELFSYHSYPLTPMIKISYPIIFIFDILYIILLYRKLREEKVNFWARL
ncbi:hypothetical protein LC605_10965 [Nostoc sp. CHAB 5836]|uniref:transmembrane-type terpene cyclase n=1 Tax=Nostoc sp. CHAB 5836 TaxID=2780404 RepID=UPI001E3B7785|nr:hypothetical protein [Nostoc sp. CHAB 5836]MCC5615582.1 hypothetical protein [Nostoc sp. CHAB 5836]